MKNRGGRLAVLGAVVAVLLTACAPGPGPSAEPEGPSLTPTPMPEAPIAEKPDTGFPIACADIDLAGLESVLGLALPLNPGQQTPFGLAASHQSGSIYCSFGGDPNLGTHLTVTAQTHPRGAPAAEGTICQAEFFSCQETVDFAGMRLHAYLQHFAGVTAAAAFTEMVGAAVALATDRGRPADWAAPDGAAPAIIDCTLFSSLDIAGAVGSGPLSLADFTNIDEGMSEPVPRESVAHGGHSRCTWYGGDTYVHFDVLSGGAWLADEATSLMTSELVGADLAFRQCQDPRPCGVVATVGLDAVAITVGGDYAPTTMSEADAIAAAELIVPAFGAL